ncbi:MAG: glycosyltransferase family 4 protein [Symploca sp. SIO3C6]|uniref:Glycosyltransferase family 4 protein n=1 Tax=Symploca sp. SIO1C4 TaxID=2607765 RepID=A0A6B3N069_9CYAN|nr:glycosyltransferase family 4 protein [Symploca sp. SIO3C6]NER26489.1 glycosyltransferase family 4 protein [Symploca sp. SIO1C4]
MLPSIVAVHPPKKILHICAVGFTVKNLLLPQIDYLLSQGLSVEVACSPGSEVDQMRRQGYIIHTIQIDRKISPLANFISIYQLLKLLRKEKYDLVHVHTPIAAVIGRIAAKIAGIKNIIYTAHGFPFHDQSSSKQYQLYFTIEKLMASITDLILSQSEEDVKTAQKSKLCSPEKIHYLGNGVDIERFNRTQLNPTNQSQLRVSLGIPETADLLVGTIGRLTRKKGSGYLIEAAAKLLPKFPNLHILVIGGQLSTDPEPFQQELLERISILGLEKYVTLTDYRQDTPELLGLLDIFTLPTFTHEGLPRSILEAMSMSLPVVATDIRGCREAVVHGKTGFIVPPQDSNRLADSLEKLLSNPELRQTFGKASRQRIEAKYDERLVFKRLKTAYKDLGVWSR